MFSFLKRKKTDYRNIRVQLVQSLGSSYYDCILEAYAFAVEHRITVNLLFPGDEIIVIRPELTLQENMQSKRYSITD